MKKIFEVEMHLRDRITLFEDEKGEALLRARGCQELISTLKTLRSVQGKKISEWVIEQPSCHSEFLVKKLICLVKKIPFPYGHEELCHCRKIRTAQVEEAIFNGAADIETLKKRTTAGTSCGTCTSDLAQLLAFWKQ